MALLFTVLVGAGCLAGGPELIFLAPMLGILALMVAKIVSELASPYSSPSGYSIHPFLLLILEAGASMATIIALPILAPEVAIAIPLMAIVGIQLAQSGKVTLIQLLLFMGLNLILCSAQPVGSRLAVPTLTNFLVRAIFGAFALLLPLVFVRSLSDADKACVDSEDLVAGVLG